MKITKHISSSQNALVKQMILLNQKSRERKKSGLFIVEGLREVERALISGWKVESLWFVEGVTQEADVKDILALDSTLRWTSCTEEVFSKFAYRSDVPNVIGVFEQKNNGLDNLKLSNKALIVGVEAIEKPGNLGAIMRTADAAGIEALVVCDQVVDIYHPNVIRNSLGGFFDLQVAVCTSSEAIAYFKKNNIDIVITYLKGSIPHDEANYTQSVCLMMGAEDKGLTDTWVQAADKIVRIPMVGVVDSLNVSVSAAIVMYEAVRQRKNELV